MIKKWGAREKKRSIMNSNEKCVTALQALWNVTYAHVRRGFALSLEEEGDGLHSWDTTPLLQQPWVATPSGHQLCCFPPEITSKESPQFFFYSKDGWLIDGFGTEKYGSNVIVRVQFKIVTQCKIVLRNFSNTYFILCTMYLHLYCQT